MSRALVPCLRAGFLLAIAAGALAGQATKTAPKAAPPAGEFAGRWFIVIDSAVSKLRLPVVATSAADLAKTLTVPPQTNLETSEDFARRNIAAVAGRTFAVRVPITAAEDPCGAKVTYEDDQEALRIAVPAQLEVTTLNLYGAALSCAMSPMGSYTAQHLGGATTVSRLKKTNVAAANHEFGALDVLIDLKIDARASAQLRTRLGLLAILAPVPDENGAVVVVSKIDEKPTAAEPLEVTGSNTFVWCGRVGFVVYDTKTGDILAKGLVDRHLFAPRRIR